MLARHGIVFLDRLLLGHGARVLLRPIEKAGSGLAVQPDLDGGWLGHGRTPGNEKRRAANLLRRPLKSRLGRAGTLQVPSRKIKLPPEPSRNEGSDGSFETRKLYFSVTR